MAIDNPYQSPTPESPAELPKAPENKGNWTKYSPEYNAAFKTALLIQAVLAVVTLLVLDFGQTHRAFWVAFLCQWAMVWIILCRRSMHPTWLDLLLVRYGIIPLLFVVAGVGPWFLRITATSIDSTHPGTIELIDKAYTNRSKVVRDAAAKCKQKVKAS
ncbi:MAG: hypothetical protein MUC83_08565 [Pirellula sp.]|nr:hypothetical protein [Pirellula sp.]